MASVTFDESVGGDGSTITDDANASTGLKQGGHRSRFVPALTQTVAVAQFIVDKAGEASDSADAAAQSEMAASESVAEAVAVIEGFEADTAAAIEAAGVAVTEADRATDMANVAAGSKDVYASTADALSNGLKTVTITGAGTGGTDGQYIIPVTGSTGDNGKIVVVVSGGVLTEAAILVAGKNYTGTASADIDTPTDLTGATVSITIGPNRSVGEYFSVPNVEDDSYIDLYLVETGPVATYQDSYPSKAAAEAKFLELYSVAPATITKAGLQNTDPVDGTVTSDSTHVFNRAITGTQFIRSISFYSDDVGTFNLKLVTRSGNDFDQIGSNVAFSVVAGLNVVSMTVFGYIEVPEGAYLGAYCPTLTLLTSGAMPEGAEWDGVYSTSGDSSSFTDSTINNSAVMVSFELATLIDDFTGLDDVIATYPETKENAALGAKVATDLIEGGFFKTYGYGYGNPGEDFPAGTNDLAGSEFVFYDGPEKAGKLRALEGSSPIGGIVDIYIREADGLDPINYDLVETITVTVPIGYYSIPLDVDITPSTRIGIRNRVSGTLRFIFGGTAVEGGYVNNAPAGAASFQDETVSTSNTFLWRFVYSTNEPATGDVDAGLSFSLKNSDKIGFVGDSTTTPGYTLPKKGWLHKLSMFTDWGIDNFSKAGDDYKEILTRMTGGDTIYGALFSDYQLTYAWLNSGINDASTYTIDEYQEALRKIVEAVKGFGAKPIVATEHYNSYGDYATLMVAAKTAKEHSCIYFDSLSHGQRFGAGANGLAGWYNNFWFGVHFGLRANETAMLPALDFINTLPRPTKSIKIFTPRSTPSGATDLNFDNLADRASKFIEIQQGERALNEAGYGEYDTLGEGLYSQVTLDSEYLSLAAGGSLGIDDYCLIDIILPGLANAAKGLTIDTGIAGLTAYGLYRATGTPSDGAIGREVVEIAIDATTGVIDLSESALNGFISEDRFSLLLYKDGGFSLKNPVVTWYGVPGKPDHKQPLSLATGAQLLSERLCGESGELSSWDISGSVAGVVRPDVLPDSATKVAVINDADTLGQDLVFSSDTVLREIEIEAVLRYYPPEFDNGDTFPDDSAITLNSFDFKKARISYTWGDGSKVIVYEELVGLWWNNVKFRTFIPPGVSAASIVVSSSDGDDLDFVSASVRFVD